MNNFFFSLVISFCMSGIFLVDAMEHNLLQKSILLPLKTHKAGTCSWSKVATICDTVDTIIGVPSTTFSWKKYDSLYACALLKNRTSTKKSENTVIQKSVQEKKEENEQGLFFSDLPEELFLPCVMTNDLFTTIKNLLTFGQVSHQYRERVLSEYCTDIVAKKFNGNPVSIAIALGNFKRPGYKYQKKWLKHMARSYSKESRDEAIKFYTKQNDISGLIALLKFKFPVWNYFFIKTNYGAGISYNKSMDILFKDETKKEILTMLLNFRQCDVNALSDEIPVLVKVIDEKTSLSFVSFFIEKGAKINTGTWYTPLIAAAAHGRKDIMKLLIDHGAQFSPDEGSKMVESLSSHLKRERGWKEDKKKDRDIKRRYNKTLKYILRSGININFSFEGWNASLLHYCIRHEHRKAVKLLLDLGIDRSIRNSDGKTALDFAKLELEHSQLYYGGSQDLTSIIHLLENYEPKWHYKKHALPMLCIIK